MIMWARQSAERPVGCVTSRAELEAGGAREPKPRKIGSVEMCAVCGEKESVA